MLLLFAAQSHLALFTGLLFVGFAIGVFGHIYHSRTLVLTGIAVIGIVSAYFSFVLQPGSGH